MIIPEQERNMIGNYIREYVGTPKVDLDYLLRFWKANKPTLFKLLGNSLTYSFEASLEKSEGELQTQWREIGRNNPHIDKFIDTVNHIINKYNEEAEKKKSFTESLYFFRSNKFIQMVQWKAFLSNVYDGESGTLELDNLSVKIQKGMKNMKILGKIATTFGDLYPDLQYFEEFRLAHSQLVNDRAYKGKITFSIHPLDFMTMSDNACDWSSCMSWEDSGCYRKGTVEMMNSPCVLVAYIEKSNPYILPDGAEWNNKRWRELFIVDKQGIFGIKGYPYWNRDIELACLAELEKLANINLNWGHFNPDPVELDMNDGYDFTAFYKDSRIELTTDAMYNDFRYSHHKAILPERLKGNIYVHYSGETECMTCGCLITDYDNEEDLQCDGCNDLDYCEDCEERYHRDELTEVDGMFLCGGCYDYRVRRDIFTEEPHLVDNMVTIAIVENLFSSHTTIAESYVYDETSETDLKEIKDWVKCNKEEYYETLVEAARYNRRFQNETIYIEKNHLNDYGKEMFGVR